MPDPNTILSRVDTAAALTAVGYRISPATLATLATRGGGPRYTRFNGKTFYRFGEVLTWAEARCASTAAEHRAARRQSEAGGLTHAEKDEAAH